MSAEDRDQQARRQADDDAEHQSCRERAEKPERQRGSLRVRRHQRGQDPRHQQAGLICGGDDREVDAA